MVDFESGRAPERKAESMKPEDIIEFIAAQGQGLVDSARKAQAMIAFAQEQGIPVDLSKIDILKDFAPLGKHEVAQVHMISDANAIASGLFLQGVKMTQEDLKAQLDKMKS